jgi:phosphonate degradation associated HDIG domain protein
MMIDHIFSRRPAVSHQPVTDEILRLFRARGDSRYGAEDVSQLEHALQAAHLAEQEGASSALIAAALLHDVGHLLHALPADAPERGIDDEHEALGGRWLASRFGPEVCEPVRLHVAAKRYLCAVEAEYILNLSQPSLHSLGLQGGPMMAIEIAAFEAQPFHTDAVRLRRWDDAAKRTNFVTPYLEHFAEHLDAAACEQATARGSTA